MQRRLPAPTRPRPGTTPPLLANRFIGGRVSLWAIMKTTITAIYEQDAEKAYREFFTKEFATQQLGQPGRWFLLGTRQPALFDPVQSSQVEKLIEKSRGNDAVRHPVAWRLDFEVGRDVTTLGPLSPKPTRERIEQGHGLAVKTALSSWLPSLSEPRRGFFEKSPGAAFALFVSGTGEGQIPYLHTTAFLFNTTFPANAGIARFPAEKVSRSEGYLDSFYVGCLGAELSHAIGRIGCSPETDVPRRLFPPLVEPSLSPGKGPSKFFDCGGPFKGEAPLPSPCHRPGSRYGGGL